MSFASTGELKQSLKLSRAEISADLELNLPWDATVPHSVKVGEHIDLGAVDVIYIQFSRLIDFSSWYALSVWF